MPRKWSNATGATQTRALAGRTVILPSHSAPRAAQLRLAGRRSQCSVARKSADISPGCLPMDTPLTAASLSCQLPSQIKRKSCLLALLMPRVGRKVILASSSASVGMRTSFRHHSSTVWVQPPSSAEFPQRAQNRQDIPGSISCKASSALGGHGKKAQCRPGSISCKASSAPSGVGKKP